MMDSISGLMDRRSHSMFTSRAIGLKFYWNKSGLKSFVSAYTEQKNESWVVGF